jgi:hypothetical protein
MSRRLRPSELARQDQYLAAADQLARENPRTLVLTTTYAPPGIQCSWCDCSDHGESPLGCAGCYREAVYAIRSSHSFTETIPICESHYPEFRHMMLEGLDGPIEITGVNVLDATDDPSSRTDFH